MYSVNVRLSQPFSQVFARSFLHLSSVFNIHLNNLETHLTISSYFIYRSLFVQLSVGLCYFHLVILAHLENRLFKCTNLIKVPEYFDEIINISLVDGYKWLRMLLKKFSIYIIESGLTYIGSDIFEGTKVYLFLLIAKNVIKSKIHTSINVVHICFASLIIVSSLRIK
jgi:hypothetical protein